MRELERSGSLISQAYPLASCNLCNNALTKVIGSFIEKPRPPANILAELDLMFSIDGQSVVLLEKRRLMNEEMIERPFAKATWIKTQEVWKLYWQRADLKWHSYQPAATVSSIEAFCRAVDEDSYSCFWG